MVAFMMQNLMITISQSMVACLPSILSSLSLPQFDMQETVWAQIILKVGKNDKNSDIIYIIEKQGLLGAWVRSNKYVLTKKDFVQ